MKLKMNKIAVAVSAAMGASMVAGVANADIILFPYVAKSPTVTTILSVINTAEQGTIVNPGAGTSMHGRYFRKANDAANDNTAKCGAFDFNIGSSQNDIVTFDAGGVFGNSKGVLFDDPTEMGNNDLAGLRLWTSARAFLLVDNNNVGVGSEGSLLGEALVLEFQNGAAWGYRALNNPGSAGNMAGTDIDFRPDNFPAHGPVLGYDGGGDTAAVAFGAARSTLLPFAEFTTRYFITPTAANQYANNINARVSSDVSLYTGRVGDAMVDRDEEPYSGSALQNIVCVGALGINQLLAPEIITQYAPMGGWTNIVVRTGNMSTVNPTGVPYTEVSTAAVIKLEYNLTGTFDGNDTGGIFNNAYLMGVDIYDNGASPATPSSPMGVTFTKTFTPTP